MITALTLALLLPQEPLSEGLSRHLVDLDLAKRANELAGEFASPPRATFGDPASPALLADLHRRKEPIVDTVLERLDLPVDRTLDLMHVQRLADAVMGRRSGKPKSTRGMDIDKFQSLLDVAYRDVNSAMGGRQNYHDLLPELQGAIEMLRGTTDAAQLSADDMKMISQRFRRMGKIERETILGISHDVLLAAVALDDERLLERLRRRPTKDARHGTAGRDVMGEVLVDKDTSFGRMVVGGFGKNRYDCTQIDVIIDLGGADEYEGPAGGTQIFRQMAVVVDLDGNDVYNGLNDGLGSATYGIGILVDLKGDDRYKAGARSAGFGLAGVGILLDVTGTDTYEFDYHCGGVGLGGVGIFADLSGNDVMKASAESFGFGLPGGAGVFVDGDGDDQRELLGVEFSDSRGAAKLGVGFGVGVGLAGVLTGGVGLCVDGRGADTYRTAGLALGAGVQGGLGVFVDMQGMDRYFAGTGSLGSAHRRGAGLFVDAAGDDVYEASGGLALGAAAHSGEAWCVDMTGDDTYFLEGIGLGTAVRPGLAGFLDLAGVDRYTRQVAPLPWGARGDGRETAGALSLFLDDGGGEDQYAWVGPMVPKNGDVQRESAVVERQTVTTVMADR